MSKDERKGERKDGNEMVEKCNSIRTRSRREGGRNDE